MNILARLLATVAILATAQSAHAQAPRQVAVTHHRITVAGAPVAYTATVADNFVAASPDERPAASLLTLAFVRDGVADRAHRPVMFVFNGGPGGSSSPLDFGAFGPRRIVETPHGRAMQDNPLSLVDAVDLVFIDPVGTGVSRPFSGVDGQPFWSVTGDAVSVKATIAAWLKENGRDASPRYVCGESYGTVRAGQLAKIGADLHLSGILLFSLVGGGGGADLPYEETFPTMAAAAAFHGRTPLTGRPVREVFDEASAFSRTQLLPALTLGDNLSASDKATMASRMSGYIGLPAEFIAEKNLRIGKYDFMLSVLKAQALRTGQLDTRAKGDTALFQARHPPYDDPSMSLGKDASSGPSTGDLIDQALAGELGFHTTEKYRTLNLEINSKWNYDQPGAGGARLGDPAHLIGDAMKADPHLRLFWTGGLYDLTTPVAAARYALDHGGVPPDRLTAVEFPTGHSVFETESSLAAFNAAVRNFVTAKP